MRSRMVMEAPAKINLYLEVGLPCTDGYHPVRTVFQCVELCDLVEIEVTDGGEGLQLAVEGDAPLGEDNICCRAAAAFLALTGKRMGIKIRLTKHIPQAAGLGGGSSDAAAVLRALNFFAGEAVEKEGLMSAAASLGMDVPFFLVGGTALGEGRGEVVTPLQQAPPLPVVLVSPGAGLPTGEVYRALDLGGHEKPPAHGPDPLVEVLPRGDVAEIAPLLYNSLQRPACVLLPGIADLLDKAVEAGAAGVLVSGSGPTLFLLAEDEKHADELEYEMSKKAPLVFRTSFRSAGVSRAG